jgi:predicted TIM-barrel enzyme
MSNRFTLGLLAALFVPAAALAVPTEACTVLKLDELNQIAGGGVVGTQVRKAGNPSECSFVDGRKASVLVVGLREVQYAAENELQYERETLEKIYRQKVKAVNTVGDSAFWLAANHQLEFRKGKVLVSVRFERRANQNEVDSEQVARLVESQIK